MQRWSATVDSTPDTFAHVTLRLSLIKPSLIQTFMQVSIRQKGRRSKTDLLASATSAVTEEFVQQCLAKDPCELGCLTRYLQPRPPLLPPSEREFAAAIADWRERLALSPNRAATILDYFNHSWTERTADGALAARSSGMRCMIPRTECSCCMKCWGLAGDLNYLEADGHVRRGSMLTQVIASFKRGEHEPQNIYSTQGNNRGQAWFRETEHFAHEGSIKAWLDPWLQGNVDQASTTAGALILDAPSRKFVYELMVQEWTAMGRHIPASSTFNRVLRKHYNIIINKHKKFAQCQVCALYKELWAKSRMESPALREEIKALRREHLEKQYQQRMCYYCARELSYSQPGKYLCMIIDAMTETSTSTPMQAREVKGFKPAEYKTQLYGAQVHGPEGFFAYTTCSMKGARVTVEVLHRTLLKLAQTRKEWPSVFTLQLDNTTSDCKNHTVLAYLAWLEAIGVFEVARLAFLMVGHTHEDIDGMFGLLRRYLWRLARSVMTIDELHDHIRKCFHKDHIHKLREDGAESHPEFTMFDEHFNLENMCQAVPVEHLWSTYDWTAFLLQEAHPDGRAFREIANIAQTQDPDVYRPHLFEFTMFEGTVVLNVKHWADDRMYWNEEPMPVWNRIPDIQDLRPASVTATKTLSDLHRLIHSCDEWYASTRLRCKQKQDGKCPRCSGTQCVCEKCARCAQLGVVQVYVDMKVAMAATENDLVIWETHFDNLTQPFADQMLVPLSKMQLPRCDRISTDLPSVQDQINNLPRIMKPAPAGLKCKLSVLGGPKAFRTMMGNVDVSVTPGLNGSVSANVSINLVVGAYRSPKGVLEFAVFQNNGVGKWVSLRELRGYEDSRLRACGEVVRARWFGADVGFESVLVQENSQRVYAANLTRYMFDSERWLLDFPAQQDNPIMGTSACAHERQLLDLEELKYAAAPCAPHVPPVEPGCASCYVHIEPLPGSLPPTAGGEVHRFWVSRRHFGLQFIQKKLRPHMHYVGGVAIDLPQLQRCVHFCI